MSIIALTAVIVAIVFVAITTLAFDLDANIDATAAVFAVAVVSIVSSTIVLILTP